MSSSRTRLTVVPTQRILVGRGLALLAALLIVAVTLAAMGRSPIALFGLVLHSTVGSRFGLEDLALFMTPLMLTGAAVWVGIRVNLWNIGAEGQFYAGATAATAVGLFTGLPPALAIPAMIVAGMAAGMAWIFVPAAARAWLGVSEIVTTLLLNFVASLLVYYLATGPWADRVTGALASTERLHVILPDIWGVVHWGFPLAVFTVVVLGVLLARSRFGYETAIAGANPEAARYAGISVAPRVLAVLLLSGGLAGLAGMVEVAGTVHRLQGGIANNYGYLGIVVALLARGSCLSLIPAALLMAFILDTGIVLQTTQISASAVLAITGLLVLAIAVGDELAGLCTGKENLMIELLTGLLGHAVLSGSVLALAALGEVIAERSGVTNLGVEGLMSLGAVVAVMTVAAIPHPWVGLLMAGLVGGLGAGVLALASVVLRANQVLCGVAVTFLGLGLSATIGRPVAGMPVPVIFEPVSVPVLSSIPVIGPAFFAQNILVYFIYLFLPLIVHFWLFRTRYGLDLRAVGENPAAVDAVGVPVTKLRVMAVMIGGILAGFAGADLTLAVVPVWSDGMIAGRGWIAVALVIFAGYRPVWAVASGLLFGLVTAIGFMGQARGWPVAPAVLNTLPYLGTIGCIIVPILAFPRLRRAMAAPAALATPYHRTGR